MQKDKASTAEVCESKSSFRSLEACRRGEAILHQNLFTKSVGKICARSCEAEEQHFLPRRKQKRSSPQAVALTDVLPSSLSEGRLLLSSLLIQRVNMMKHSLQRVEEKWSTEFSVLNKYKVSKWTLQQRLVKVKMANQTNARQLRQEELAVAQVKVETKLLNKTIE